MDATEKYPLALPKGTVLAGQYVIDSVLGQGGFGITYKATDHKSNENVAVKEFFPDTLAYRDAAEVISYPGERSENFEYGKEGFLQEAQTLAQFIGNENIARIHSYFEENGTAYFVMEYIDGISFDEYIKRKGGKITVDEAERVLIPIMDALDAVHAAGIVHRDVTPDNIYICQDGKIKLLDFGAARYSLGDKSRSLDVILKHGFAPKEQYTRRGRQGPYTDIYSIAATFYFAITGKRPPDSVERLDEDDLVPPSALGVDITDYQEKALFTALEVQPQNRFQSMAVFKKVLLNERIANTAAAAPTPAPEQAAEPVIRQPEVMQEIPRTVAASPHPSPVPAVNQAGQPTAQVKKGSKKIAIGAACALIAAAIGAAILVPSLTKSDDDDDDDSSSKHSAVAVDDSVSDDGGDDGGDGSSGSDKPAVTTSKPDDGLLTGTTTTTTKTTTDTPPSSSTGDTSLDVLDMNNVHLGGSGTVVGSTFYFIDNWGNDVTAATTTETKSIFTDLDKPVSNLTRYGDKYLYFLYDKTIYCYFPDTGKNEEATLLSQFKNKVEKFYITGSYFFIYSDKTLYRVDFSGNVEESYSGIEYPENFILVDGNLYILGVDTNGDPGLFKMPADNFAAGAKGISNATCSWDAIASDGSYIYIASTNISTGQVFIEQCDLALSQVYASTEVSSVVDSISMLTVYNNNVFFGYYNVTDSNFPVYSTTLSGTTFSKPSKITDYALSYNIAVYSGGGFRFSYFGEDGKSYYREYDK